MLNFQPRLYNFPGERLSNPRIRLPGLNIDKHILKFLPFKEKSFDQINECTDCIQFLEYFNDMMFDNENDLKEYITRDEIYDHHSKSTDNAQTATYIVTTLKYQFVTKRLLQLFCGDDTALVYHLPFLAEATYDLECSYYLMKGGFFKQSLQTLRNILEVTLLHAYFGLKYLNWEEMEIAMKGKYPSLKEMIIYLRTEKLLYPHLEGEYFKLYKELSLAVHSEIDKLTAFKSFTYINAFSEWYNSFINVAKLNIITTVRMAEIGF